MGGEGLDKYIGQTFNHWTVLSFSHKKGYLKFYNCRCSCGVERPVFLQNLKSGQSNCCGCLNANPPTNRKFGMLKPIYVTRIDKHKNKHYLCKCDCGNEKEVPASSLLNNKAKCCGCLYRIDDFESHFFSFVDKSGECWLWTGGKTASFESRQPSYGAVKFNGKTCKAHRVSWELKYGKIPDGLFICHKCDVPLCVNPDHFFLGTHQENMKDRDEKGRCVSLPGEENGFSKLKNENILYIRENYEKGMGEKLAKEFKVNASTILRIAKGERWKHI